VGDTARWLGFLAGAGIVMAVTYDVVRTLVVPRGANDRLSNLVEHAVRHAFVKSALLVSRSHRRGDVRGRYELVDRVLAVAGPTSLLIELLVWQVAFVVGFGLAQWPFLTEGDLRDALREAGSSFFTLGYETTPTPGATLVNFVSAACGVIVVALLIGYLPTLYGAFNRREQLVTLLESRAGSPAWGPEILARQQLIGTLDSLPSFYRDWEQWAADVGETHSNYPILVRFRSPDPYRSWIVGLQAVLDAAALHLALAPSVAPSEARLCLRMGFTALRVIADTLQLPYERDPHPGDPVQLTVEEYRAGVRRLTDTGFPVERDPDEAFADFRGWRVNYESLALRIADLVDAPPAPWSGRRTHFPEVIAPERPRDRRPDDPEGERSRARYPGWQDMVADGGRDGSGPAQVRR